MTYIINKIIYKINNRYTSDSAHGSKMSQQIDPYGGPIELFLIPPANVPQLV